VIAPNAPDLLSFYDMAGSNSIMVYPEFSYYKNYIAGDTETANLTTGTLS